MSHHCVLQGRHLRPPNFDLVKKPFLLKHPVLRLPATLIRHNSGTTIASQDGGRAKSDKIHWLELDFSRAMLELARALIS